MAEKEIDRQTNRQTHERGSDVYEDKCPDMEKVDVLSSAGVFTPQILGFYPNFPFKCWFWSLLFRGKDLQSGLSEQWGWWIVKIGGMGSGNIISSSHPLDGNPLQKIFTYCLFAVAFLWKLCCITIHNQKGTNPVDFCTVSNFKEEYIFFISYPSPPFTQLKDRKCEFWKSVLKKLSSRALIPTPWYPLS